MTHLRAALAKPPFKSREEDWCAYIVAETAADAVTFIIGDSSSLRPIWVHKPLLQIIAAEVDALDEHSAFVEVGAGIGRWIKAQQPNADTVHRIEFRGWCNPTLALVCNDAVYVWSSDDV